MANGDAAALAGMDVVAGTADLRNAYDEENKGRDYLAAHLSGGTHPASAINSGVLDIVRIPDIPVAKLVGDVAQLGGGGMTFEPVGAQYTASGNLGVVGTLAAGGVIVGGNGLVVSNVYGNVLSTAYRAVWIRSDGTFGYVPSSARFKSDIETAVLDVEQLLAIRLVWFRYNAAIAELGKKNAPREFGVIAEEIHELGLTWLVDYDEEGKPFGVKGHAFTFVAMFLAQLALTTALDNAARISLLEQAKEQG